MMRRNIFTSGRAAARRGPGAPGPRPDAGPVVNYIAEHRDAPQNVVHSWINGVGVRAAYDF
jgi:hypothetical protein